MKIYKITTTQIWPERDYIEKARVDSIIYEIPVEGYAKHRGNEDHDEYPHFDWGGSMVQVSGATEATFEDAVAWFGHDALSVTFEEIGRN